ncbi:HNH endonuclease [Neolewinella marina]|uniref:HNH endonuclease n=1 Tax=Neolewinella marina TaxID=438751 RepID=UPI003873A82D
MASRKLKELYSYECQVCRTSIQTNAGLYIEAAHIQPLGTPHNGPDVISNILCLCPNHHVRFDYGGFTVSDTLELIGEKGRLFVHPKHALGQSFLAYHRAHRYDAGW